MKKLYLTLLTTLFALGLQAQASDEQDQVDKAAEIIKRFKNLPEREIPLGWPGNDPAPLPAMETPSALPSHPHAAG